MTQTMPSLRAVYLLLANTCHHLHTYQTEMPSFIHSRDSKESQGVTG